METWQKTCCVCCCQNCGLEVMVEDNRITKVRPDKANARSEGYNCRKGLKIGHYQSNADRLTHPLKRTADGFEEISWDQALDEISAKLKEIIGAYGPRSFAFMGGGGQGSHFHGVFGVNLMRALGSRYHYTAVAQEWTGRFWVHGRTFGKQNILLVEDVDETDVLVSVGWNGWHSHMLPQARRHLKRISEDPDKLLVAIDPRRSETAERADIHLALRPGTDALLRKAMIAIILEEGWQDDRYMADHVTGFDEVAAFFQNFDVKAALELCELRYDDVKEVCRQFAGRRSCFHSDLGVLMNRHTTLVSWLEVIMSAICGRIGVRGGNMIPGSLLARGGHTDERDPRTWRTVATDIPAIAGNFPPNVMPEEIMSDSDERLRAVLVSGANPLRSYADTTAYEEAFSRLDLLVTVDLVMSETARLSHYVLPARSAYEKWDGAFFSWNYPEVFFQMRKPLAEPEGEPLEDGQIMTALADRLGLIPEIPQSLFDAAKAGRITFGKALMEFVQANPASVRLMPFIMAKTLGPQLGSTHLAALWGFLSTLPRSVQENAARVGFDSGPLLGEQLFTAILDRAEGLWVGTCDTNGGVQRTFTDDGKIHLSIPELFSWLQEIEPESEAKALAMPREYPFILNAGRHFDYNANTIVRDPAWHDGRQPCTMLVHPSDAEAAGLEDGQMARVSTDAGSEGIQVEISDATRPGMVVIPHGFGLVYDGRKYGANVNRLTRNTHRDRVAAIPLHKFVPCRIEPL